MLAVGHSYGGAMMTNAATKVKHVVGLVHVAAFAPRRAKLWGSLVAPLTGPHPPASFARQTIRPGRTKRRGWELTIDPESFDAWDGLGGTHQAVWFRDVFDRIQERGR
jgi:pimeloyl-ACP methyl ester carboxylesterase